MTVCDIIQWLLWTSNAYGFAFTIEQQQKMLAFQTSFDRSSGQ